MSHVAIKQPVSKFEKTDVLTKKSVKPCTCSFRILSHFKITVCLSDLIVQPDGYIDEDLLLLCFFCSSSFANLQSNSFGFFNHALKLKFCATSI